MLLGLSSGDAAVFLLGSSFLSAVLFLVDFGLDAKSRSKADSLSSSSISSSSLAEGLERRALADRFGLDS